ncbi:MAG: hypothetical protein ACKO91_06775 [Acidimicrobiales bacterium]
MAVDVLRGTAPPRPGEAATTLRFAQAARALTAEARRCGLVAPGFRSPPRLPGADRSLLRRNGMATVAVRVRGRAWEAVLADLIAGIIVVNGLVGPEADRVRSALWAAAGYAPMAAAA